MSRWRWQSVAWLLGCLAAVGARLALMAFSAGSNDIRGWTWFARSIGTVGLLETYRTSPAFNHPPLMGLWALAADHLAAFTGLAFPFVFRLLPVAGDVLAAWLLFRYARAGTGSGTAPGLACLFLWNPVSLLITAYHGNTDPLLAALCLWAALRAEKGDALGTALALGAALNVKLVPLVLLAPLALSTRRFRDLLVFAAGLLAAALPFVPVLVLAGRPFVEHALLYNSLPAMWGLNLLLTDLQELRRFGDRAAPLQAAFLANARYVIVGTIALAALLLKHRGGQRWVALCAFGLCLVLVLAPGFGYQYLAWPMPLLFAVHARRAALTSLAGGVLLGLLYLHYWDGAIPASSIASTWPRFGVVWGVITWLALAGWTWRLGVEAIRGNTAPAPP